MGCHQTPIKAANWLPPSQFSIKLIPWQRCLLYCTHFLVLRRVCPLATSPDTELTLLELKKLVHCQRNISVNDVSEMQTSLVCFRFQNDYFLSGCWADQPSQTKDITDRLTLSWLSMSSPECGLSIHISSPHPISPHRIQGFMDESSPPHRVTPKWLTCWLLEWAASESQLEMILHPGRHVSC